MAKSEELDWLMGPPQLKFGDIKKKIWNYVSLGDTIYITGELILNGNQGEALDSIYLENEPAIVIKKRASGWENVLDVAFGENVTNTQVWYDNMPDDDGKVDLGSVEADDDLLITLPNKPINESEEFDWTDDFQWTTDMLYSMLENCNEIKISNYSLKMDSAYKSAGGPVIYTLTRCKEWWDRFSTIELDGSGRGPAEWYDDYDEGRIGLISTYKGDAGNIRDIDWENNEYGGWTISQEPQQIVDSLNGKGSELFILLDDKGKPVYDLIPKKHRERIKTNWEDRFYGKELNESEGDLQWIKDIKTNDDITQEIYDGLVWYKVVGYNGKEDTDFVDTQWNDIPFSVRPANIRKKAIITPGVFYRGWRNYMRDIWGVYDLSIQKEIFEKLKELVYQKVGEPINESSDWGWAKEIPGTKEYGEEYRYFEIIACYGFDYETEECDDEYSHFVKIPKYEVDEIWDGWVDYFGGSADEGAAVISYAIDNNLIPPRELEEIVGFEGVREIDEELGRMRLEESKKTNKSDLDWVKDVEPEGFNKNNSYVIDVRDLRPETPMSTSSFASKYTELTKQDILEDLEDIGYDVEDVDTNRAAFLYIEPSADSGYWDGPVWVEQYFQVDWDEDSIEDPTYGGRYQMIGVDELMFFLDNNLIRESSDFEWIKEIEPITEAAGISFEARKWGEIIYNEIMNNPNEKKRLIIDGYDHPEAFDGFPIDYVVIDFYDRLTGYGQEHSGYDKDGNYIVLLYVQPRLLQGQGGYDLKSVLNHEMKHAWEDYNRLSKGLPSVEHTKESQELYNKDFVLMLSDQNVRGPIKEILKYYYYLSNLEKSAYLENVYDQNPVYEGVVRDIASKDFESFKDRFDLDVNWHLMNTAYNIPFLKKFKSPREFIDYSAEELRSKAVKITKKINKMRYIHGK